MVEARGAGAEKGCPSCFPNPNPRLGSHSLDPSRLCPWGHPAEGHRAGQRAAKASPSPVRLAQGGPGSGALPSRGFEGRRWRSLLARGWGSLLARGWRTSPRHFHPPWGLWFPESRLALGSQGSTQAPHLSLRQLCSHAPGWGWPGGEGLLGSRQRGCPGQYRILGVSTRRA